jgi:hypothetical protein
LCRPGAGDWWRAIGGRAVDGGRLVMRATSNDP